MKVRDQPFAGHIGFTRREYKMMRTRNFCRAVWRTQHTPGDLPLRATKRCLTAFLAMCVSTSSLALGEYDGVAADLILFNTKVWTADENRPLAEAVAIRGSKIVAVGTNEEVLRLLGPSVESFDLQGRLVIPGFIDGHTHFENAIEWFFEARLMDIDTEARMIERLAEAVQRVPKGLWITGGDWGEMAARDARKRGLANYVSFIPGLIEIDAVSPDHPVLFRRHDGSYFANSLAFKTLRINKYTPDPGGGSYIHDTASGELTGMLMHRAGDRAHLALPPKTRKLTLIAARELMKELNRNGITSIGDIARIEEASQQMNYLTNVERSYSDVSIFSDLKDEGALTVRVHALLPLAAWDALHSRGIGPGSGDKWIQFGALKSFIDGTLMFEPYDDKPNYSGNFTFRVQSPQLSHDNFLAADRLRFEMATHVIGDEAISMYLDWLEEAIQANGPRDRRPRLIHMCYPRLEDIKRAGVLHAFADITPSHMMGEVESIEKRLGPERAQYAYTGKTLIDNGVRINLVSDWPGDYYKIDASPLNPLTNIYLAVVRHYPGEPDSKSWHRDEAISIEDGLRAYTINPAWATHEEKIKGSITVGKLADLVVLSADVLAGSADDLLDTNVLLTVVDGKVVYRDNSL